MVEVIVVRKGVCRSVRVCRVRIIPRRNNLTVRCCDVARYLVIVGIRGIKHHTSRVVVLRCDSARDLLHTLPVAVVDVSVRGAVACRVGVRIGSPRYLRVNRLAYRSRTHHISIVIAVGFCQRRSHIKTRAVLRFRGIRCCGFTCRVAVGIISEIARLYCGAAAC